MEKSSKIFMVRPACFQYNEQTASSNAFQNKSNSTNFDEIQSNALAEFNALAEKLISKKINVTIFDDTINPKTPDSIFPNNWISFHNNKLILYPMLAENRRLERRKEIIDSFKTLQSEIIDLTAYEKKNVFLEGTGSIVFDYKNKIAYANISPRTDKDLFEKLCIQLNYKPISFKAIDQSGKDIYHTNVLMCVGNGFAILCSECIPNKNELNTLKTSLIKTQHEIISITYNQMNSFAGNMYQLYNEDGKSYILMSEQAYNSLNKEQIQRIESYGEVIHSPLYTIEKYGGGSARCMIADIRL